MEPKAAVVRSLCRTGCLTDCSNSVHTSLKLPVSLSIAWHSLLSLLLTAVGYGAESCEQECTRAVPCLYSYAASNGLITPNLTYLVTPNINRR